MLISLENRNIEFDTAERLITSQILAAFSSLRIRPPSGQQERSPRHIYLQSDSWLSKASSSASTVSMETTSRPGACPIRGDLGWSRGGMLRVKFVRGLTV